MITQIGSVPFGNVDEALAYSWKHEIPFLPELVLNGEGMFDYIKNPGKLSCLDRFKSRKYSIVKVQCVGPATLIAGVFDAEDAVERIRKHVDMILDGLNASEVILFLDEPSLGKFKGDFGKLWKEVFDDRRVVRGVHCCGEGDWKKLFDSDIDVVSFDSSRYDVGKYRNGKRIAWGVSKFEDVKDFREGDFLTLPCGMSHEGFDVELEFRKLVDIGIKLKGN